MTNKEAIEKIEDKKRFTCQYEYIPIIKTPCFECDGYSHFVPEAIIVRCKDCKHKPVKHEPYENGLDLNFPDDECPLRVPDPWYSQMPDDDWFCANGEKEDKS